MSALQSQSSLLRFGFGQTKDTVPGLVDPMGPTCLNLDLSLRTSTLELAVDSVSGCTCACCTVLLKSKQKFVVCQADRPVVKCIKFIAELADLI